MLTRALFPRSNRPRDDLIQCNTPYLTSNFRVTRHTHCILWNITSSIDRFLRLLPKAGLVLQKYEIISTSKYSDAAAIR